MKAAAAARRGWAQVAGFMGAPLLVVLAGVTGIHGRALAALGLWASMPVIYRARAMISQFSIYYSKY